MNKARFLTHLNVRCDDMPFVLCAPLRFYSALLGLTISVPEHFKTDLASIPWLAQWLIPKEGRHNRAAVVHDWLYANGMAAHVVIDRKTADAVLLEAMHAVGVDPDRAEIIHLGVRIGGWWPWGKYRRRAKRG